MKTLKQLRGILETPVKQDENILLGKTIKEPLREDVVDQLRSVVKKKKESSFPDKQNCWSCSEFFYFSNILEQKKLCPRNFSISSLDCSGALLEFVIDGLKNFASPG